MKFTQGEQDKLLKSMTIVCDTREQKNEHITNYFDSKNIPWVKEKLPYADYSFKIPCNEKLGITRELYFDKDVVIERKANLEELSNNFTTERNRIKNEFSNAPKNKVLLIENASYEMMVDGNYNTKYNPKSFWATSLSMWNKYNIPVMFMKNPNYSGQFIYGYLYYYFYNIIKGG